MSLLSRQSRFVVICDRVTQIIFRRALDAHSEAFSPPKRIDSFRADPVRLNAREVLFDALMQCSHQALRGWRIRKRCYISGDMHIVATPATRKEHDGVRVQPLIDIHPPRAISHLHLPQMELCRSIHYQRGIAGNSLITRGDSEAWKIATRVEYLGTRPSYWSHKNILKGPGLFNRSQDKGQVGTSGEDVDAFHPLAPVFNSPR
jgi:hypothetical protein